METIFLVGTRKSCIICLVFSGVDFVHEGTWIGFLDDHLSNRLEVDKHFNVYISN